MASPGNNVLYIGVANNLVRRVYEHRSKESEELEKGVEDDLIHKVNPTWKDISEDW